jgi:hypothetical protein
MERITRKHLERLCETVARETGKTGDRFAIDGAYGGFAFERNDSNVFRNGHQPARAVYDLMHAYLAGWRDCEDRAKRQQVAA